VQIVYVAVEMSNNPHCIVHHWNNAVEAYLYFLGEHFRYQFSYTNDLYLCFTISHS